MIRRADHVQFITDAYRELLTATKRRQLIAEIKSLSEQQGGYLQIFKNSQAQLEVVIAKEPGYLLAETIWYHFNRPKNFIFCEALADTDEVILIVVREGQIYLDEKIPKDILQDELLPLLIGEEKFEVYTSGDVALQANKNDTGFCLPKEKILNFTPLAQPMLPQLPTLTEFQLLPLALAIKSVYLGRGFPIWQFAIASLLVILTGWWVLTPHHINPTVPHFIKHQKDPWQAYHRALESPRPDFQLQQLSAFIHRLYLLPGWETSRIIGNAHTLIASMHENGGTLTELRQWAQQQKLNFQLTTQSPELTLHLIEKSRSVPIKVENVQHFASQMIDQLDEVLATPSVTIKDIAQVGQAQRMRIVIYLNRVSTATINMLTQVLQHYPLTLDTIHLNLKNHSISGSIQISAWGS